jgi:hypothetical protein
MSASTRLPYGVMFSGILRALSGTPYAVSAGFDIDGDGQVQNDRPAGLPITVGRENVDESLRPRVRRQVDSNQPNFRVAQPTAR